MLASYNKKRALALQVLFFFTSALEEAIQARERARNSGQNEILLNGSAALPDECKAVRQRGDGAGLVVRHRAVNAVAGAVQIDAIVRGIIKEQAGIGQGHHIGVAAADAVPLGLGAHQRGKAAGLTEI